MCVCVLVFASRREIELTQMGRRAIFKHVEMIDWQRDDVTMISLPGIKFEIKIINIHPALLPGHGGKGFYGEKVHQSVLSTKPLISGITIHYVDEHYDNGDVIFQARCKVTADDTAETLAAKVHMLEHEYFPQVVEQLLAP